MALTQVHHSDCEGTNLICSVLVNALPVKIRSALVCVAMAASAGSGCVVTAAFTWAAMSTTFFAVNNLCDLAVCFHSASHVIYRTGANMGYLTIIVQLQLACFSCFSDLHV